MLKYGGRHENYFSRYRVTHIICSNLPDSKIKNLRFILCVCVFFFPPPKSLVLTSLPKLGVLFYHPVTLSYSG